jgi:NodT family efflux transporter outer membrane factor (OMF) lipoprotein
MLKSLLAVPILLLLLTGCATHQQQSARPLDLPGEFPSALSDQPALTGRWWQIFKDPDLNRLEEKLFAANLDLVQGHARLRQSEALMRQSRALRYPSLSLDAQTGSSSLAARPRDLQGESSQLSLSAGYEIDLFNKLSARSRAAEYNYQAAQHDLQSLYLSLSAQLADLYFLAIEQRMQLALADKTIAGHSDSLQRVEDRYRLGLVTALDLYQARQNLAAARAGRLNTQQTLTVAENALAILLGRYPGTQIFSEQSVIPYPPPQLPSGLPAELLQNRPDIRAAFLRVAARDAEVAAAIAERFPSVNLAGSYGLSGSDLTGTLIRGEFWNLLVKFSQPLLDGGRRKAEVERNRAVFAEALAGYQSSVLRSFQDVENALNANRTLAERIEHLSDQESATSAAQRLALDRYLKGLSDYLPVLAAQIFHFTGQSQLLAAKRQLISQRISLARAIGGSWMTEQLQADHQQLADREKSK